MPIRRSAISKRLKKHRVGTLPEKLGLKKALRKRQMPRLKKKLKRVSRGSALNSEKQPVESTKPVKSMEAVAVQKSGLEIQSSIKSVLNRATTIKSRFAGKQVSEADSRRIQEINELIKESKKTNSEQRLFNIAMKIEKLERDLAKR